MKNKLAQFQAEVSIDITGAMACIDVVFNKLFEATSPENSAARKRLIQQRGEAITALNFFDGYLLALCGPSPLAVIKSPPLSKSRLRNPHIKHERQLP